MFGTLVVFGEYMTTKVLDCWYDLGYKGKGKKKNTMQYEGHPLRMRLSTLSENLYVHFVKIHHNDRMIS